MPVVEENKNQPTVINGNMPKKIPKIVKEICNNPPPPVNYAYQKNISYSQMSIFRSCPHRWKLQYKDKIKAFTSSIHTVFGSAIHEAIQHYLTVMYTSSGVEADNINLEEYFQTKFVNEYKTQYDKNNKTHFSTAGEMREFFDDGISILNWFKKKRGRYFSKRGWYLVGCEVPLVIAPNKKLNNLLYQSYLDVVLYHEPTNKFKILDIKTSTRGWRDQDKKNEEKQFQLLLYKQYFSEQYNIPLDDIGIEFFIVKRKVLDWDDEKIMSPHQAYRVQTFTPPSGKIKLNKAKKSVEDFINECFSYNGEIKDINFSKNPSKWNCSFCPYLDTEHCSSKSSFFT